MKPRIVLTRFVHAFSVMMVVASLLSGTGGRAGSSDWNVAVLDQILAATPVAETTASVGDMTIPRAYLQNWRNRLAGAPQPHVAFNGGFTPWTGGNVYYSFSNNVSAAKQKAFLDGAAEWATFANLRFLARTTQTNYVTIFENPALSGGQSAVGMIGGQQFLQLGPNAWNRPTICHELGHTLGLVHEHQRSDRTNFVTIFTNNVSPGNLANFVLLVNSTNRSAYDFYSVMHYARNALSVAPGLDTIQPLPAYTKFINIMGQLYDPVLSTNDRAGMAAVYGPGPVLSNVVTNTLDSGPGSLRAAMYYAIEHPGTTITFNIPAGDAGFSNNVFNIQPSDALPSLWANTTLDATTEPLSTNPNGPEILLDGRLGFSLSVFPSGLRFRGTNCTARGFTIQNFPSFSVLMDGTNCVGNTVSGCYLGIDPTGNIAVTNGVLPLQISGGAISNVVGGTTVAARNVIGGSVFQGLVIRDDGTRFNTVLGNYIGLNAPGSAALANGWSGIQIFGGAQSNLIGGFTVAARNVISGNNFQGIAISDVGTSGNVIAGNFIGLNPAGSAALANGWSGIDVFNGAAANIIGPSNVIAGNFNYGVAISSTSLWNVVQGNIIGLNAVGTAPVPNSYAGIGIFGGSVSNSVGGVAPVSRNVISGNNHQGVSISGAGTMGNVVAGNFIGVNAAGTAAVPNTWAGVEMFGGARSNFVGGATAASANLISGNSGQGVAMDGTGTMNNFVTGNLIGVNLAGTAALPNGGAGAEIFGGAQNNFIGGSTSGAGNVISGNLHQGVSLSGVGTSGNQVQGNFIGVNAAGVAAIGNAWAGVNCFGSATGNSIGGTVPGAGNVISGNKSQGVLLQDSGTSGNLVQGNFIGLNAAGTSAVSNSWSGVDINNGAAGNVVGGYGGARNFISGNGNYGVIINFGSSLNVVQGNTIGLNGTNGGAIPNNFDAVLIYFAASNFIGGTLPGAANLIVGAMGQGVLVYDASSTNNTIRGNSIYGSTGAAIFNYLGGNAALAAPVLASVSVNTNTLVIGTNNGAAGKTFVIDFYADAPPAPLAQSQTYLGAISVLGTGANAAFSASLGVILPPGRVVTATVTDPAGNTSQLSSGIGATMTSAVNDGISDLWRVKFFGSSTTNASSAWFADPDRDGLNNLQEFLSGTNPTNAASVFKVTALNPNLGSNVVTFTSAGGIVYRVVASDDLKTNQWNLLADQVIGNGTNLFFSDPAAPRATKRFYRAQVLW